MIKLEYKPYLIEIFNNTVYSEGELAILYNDAEIAVFKANSGGHGKGCIPHGLYKLKKATKLSNDSRWNSFRKEGHPWWSSLTAMFKTDRNALGLHADGGLLGSLGCLTIMEDDLMFYESIARLLDTQGEIVLTVY